MRTRAIVISVLAACDSSGGGGGGGDGIDANNNPGGDARVFLDAPPSVPAMITISGTAAEGGLDSATPVADVVISVFRGDETTPLATTMTDAQGKYSIAIPTNGAPVAAYVKGIKMGSNYKTSYSFPSGPVFADSSGNDVNMITSSNYNLLNQFASGNQMAGKGLIAVAVLDASMQPVAGATVASMPESGPYRYNNSGGYPSASSTSTANDGFAYMFNVPGKVTINASKSGMTFKAHDVIGHPDAFTSTSIVAQ